MSWKKGPLPKDTWNWGGVVPNGDTSSGFYFADFHGEYAVMNPGDGSCERTLKADEIAWYDNSLEMPPTHLPPATNAPSPAVCPVCGKDMGLRIITSRSGKIFYYFECACGHVETRGSNG